MRKRIDAVLFDFDHTLGVDHQLEERVLRDLAQRHCGAAPSDEEIIAALARFRSGDESLATMLANAFERWGYRGDVLAEYKSEVMHLAPTSVEPMSGAAETLRTLKTLGVLTAILSNGWTELQRAKAAMVGFDGPVIVSEEIGAWKPDKRAFEIAAEKSGVEVRESMYVGDSPVADVAGSKGAGMIAVWANLENREYPADAIAPDYTITRLDQLPKIVLGRPAAD
jgi:5'-nucleotidase